MGRLACSAAFGFQSIQDAQDQFPQPGSVKHIFRGFSVLRDKYRPALGGQLVNGDEASGWPANFCLFVSPSVS
jgi:hypothetical protein